jgi:hypothetical protein
LTSLVNPLLFESAHPSGWAFSCVGKYFRLRPT